jgi:hypothetical protein
MRLKQSFISHFSAYKSTAIILYIVFAGVFLTSAIFMGIYISQVPEAADETQIGGFFGMFNITFFIMGIASAAPTLRISLANGISRKTEFLGILSAGIAITLAVTIINMLLGGIIGIFMNYTSEFSDMYSGFANNEVTYVLTEFLYCIISLFTFLIVGNFIGMLYYRMNKFLKLVVSIGVPVLFAIVLPALLGFYSNTQFVQNIIHLASDFGDSFSTDPYFATFSTSICLIIFATLGFLLIRKAPLKT